MSDHKKIKIIICSITAIIALLFGLLIPHAITGKKRRCTEPVQGVIVSVEEHDSGDGTMYAPVYEVEIDGETRQFTSSVSTNIYPDVGKELTMYLNPDNHDEIYVPGVVEIIVIVFRVVGVIFLLICILFAIARL